MKRALLIGIDSYTNFDPLRGCVNDVHALEPLLARNDDDSPNFACQRLTSDMDSVTGDTIRVATRQLLAGGAEVALFYFAGHGSERENDVSLVTSDGTDVTPGVLLSELLSEAQRSPVNEVVVILDCCFSGGAGGIPQLGSASAAIREGVTVLTASRSDQPAAETTSGRGAFSEHVCGALDGGAADVLGKVTVAGLYSYLSESFGVWEQRPTFKTNIERLHELRMCKPAVPLPDLRELAQIFSAADAELPLDPSYEPDAEPQHEEHQRVFAILQKCRAAKLVEPVGEEHMYFAAMASKPCRLTPLGRHYWYLSDEGRI